jgi:hypothetical protein
MAQSAQPRIVLASEPDFDPLGPVITITWKW